jgi:hypothetical protein
MENHDSIYSAQKSMDSGMLGDVDILSSAIDSNCTNSTLQTPSQTSLVPNNNEPNNNELRISKLRSTITSEEPESHQVVDQATQLSQNQKSINSIQQLVCSREPEREPKTANSIESSSESDGQTSFNVTRNKRSDGSNLALQDHGPFLMGAAAQPTAQPAANNDDSDKKANGISVEGTLLNLLFDGSTKVKTQQTELLEKLAGFDHQRQETVIDPISENLHTKVLPMKKLPKNSATKKLKQPQGNVPQQSTSQPSSHAMSICRVSTTEHALR